MFAFIKSITSAANRLARNLTALADTVSEVNAGLRQQLALDRPEKPARKAKEVIEHKPQADAPASACGTPVLPAPSRPAGR
jgi:hypothetical protein